MKILFTDPIFFGHYSDAAGVLFYGGAIILLLICIAIRNIPPFSFVWSVLKWVMIYLLVIFTLDFIKKEVKEWWSK
jgi:hypothetical protein